MLLRAAVPEDGTLAPRVVPTYRRYHIETREARDVAPHPSRFRVRVRRLRLLRMVLRELLVEYRRTPQVALSRPCVYGVFDRAVGGLLPRHAQCVGCLRCTTQYPDVVQILPNPKRRRLGDAYLKPDLLDSILYEARGGRVPVRGAGYRGPFGGEGWDSMWTDMSEIVRPTRDGIHGREFISTAVDLGPRPAFLRFGPDGEPLDALPEPLPLPIPFLFDRPAQSLREGRLLRVLAGAARELQTLALLPLPDSLALGLRGTHVAPVLTPGEVDGLEHLPAPPVLLELEGWVPAVHERLTRRFPKSVIVARVPMDADIVAMARDGGRAFHLCADYHGHVGERFALELILEAHTRLVEAGLREEVTLIGSGGVVAAEHVPKAIICGLDAVALDTAVWAALQARFVGECRRPLEARLVLPGFTEAWGVQRLKNLVAAWRDQLLEVLGAMGLREVRRLRGETGRGMFQKDLEAEAFSGIEGYVG